MAIRRGAIIVALAAAALLGGASPAAAENGGDTEQGEAAGLFRAAFAEYRQALVALKAACGGSRAASSECAEGVKELRAFVREVREVARETVERIREERKAALEKERAEKERMVAEEKERVQKERAAAEEQRKAAERERQKAEEAKRNAEKQKQAEQAKKQPVQNVGFDAAKRKEHIKNRLAALEELIEFKRAEWEKADALLRRLREALERAAGPERERLLREAAETERASGEHADWFFAYEAEKKQLLAEAERLAKTVAPDIAAKAAKLEQRIRDLESTAAYKMSKHDEAHAQADEYRRAAATKSGAEREKYEKKAAEMGRQADEWERLARDYEKQAGAARAELDRLLGR